MQIKTETVVGLFILFAFGIFFYMTFNIGVFRLDAGDYQEYRVCFPDVSGLHRKADVKIAGVKVGWVSSIDLLDHEHTRACATVMVHKRYDIYQDACAFVRQEGLLGTRYLELIPGSSNQPKLTAGQTLQVSTQPVNVEDLMSQCKVIAANVEKITGSLITISNTFERTLMNNEQHVHEIITDFKNFAREMREGWPTIQQSVDRVSCAVEDAATQASTSIRDVGDVAQKINEGKGLVGKLVNEDEIYNDIKYTVQGLKNYFAKVDQLGIIFDAYSENMWGIGEHFRDHVDKNITKKDSKGYFGIRIQPTEDRFYILQAVSSRKGWVERYAVYSRYDPASAEIPHAVPPPLFVDPTAIPPKTTFEDPSYSEKTIQHRDGKLKFNIQIAKCFKDLAFRFGLFENTAGVAIDYNIPFPNEKFRWVTSVEAYDFYGDDRINDQRPHFKWLNRLFFLNNFYMTFGADDFISKHNANAFFGIGLRFADDDMKFITGKVSSFASS